jgi:hypothetical protein
MLVLLRLVLLGHTIGAVSTLQLTFLVHQLPVRVLVSTTSHFYRGFNMAVVKNFMTGFGTRWVLT